MMGLPQAGKSTAARNLSAQRQAPIVNPDSIRLALHGKRFESLAETFVWAIAKTMVRSLFIAGHETVIVDATNTSRKRRDFWQPEKGEEWQPVIHLISTDTATCKDRAGDDLILGKVIQRMAEEWEEPGTDEVVNLV